MTYREKLLISSETKFVKDTTQLSTVIIDTLSTVYDKRYLIESQRGEEKVLSSYTYISDYKATPLAILNLPYLEDNDFITRELIEFLKRLGQVYLLMMILAICIGLFFIKVYYQILKNNF